MENSGSDTEKWNHVRTCYPEVWDSAFLRNIGAFLSNCTKSATERKVNIHLRV